MSTTEPIPRELLETYLDRKARQAGLADPADYAFGPQRHAILDPSRYVACLCSGRAGKTRGFLLKAIRVMQDNPGCVIPYIALTRQSAKRILWTTALQVSRELGLDLKPHVSELTLEAPNGAQIALLGANREEEIEKLRGFPMPLAGIDEAASFRDGLLSYLIHDVLTPRLIDMGGQLWLVGTPGPIPAGFFFDVTDGEAPGFSVHRWTIFENPHLPNAREAVDELIQLNGWTWEHPTVQREYLGKWARDDSVLVYPSFVRSRNLVDRLPDDYYSVEARRRSWAHVMGIDFGYVDECAWVTWAFRTRGDDRRTWAVHAMRKGDLLAHQAAEVTKDLLDRFDPVKVVGDAGGLGKPYIEEARRRFELPIVPAEKTEKHAHIELLNADFGRGRALLLENETTPYVEELETVQWRVDRVQVANGGRVSHEQRRHEDPRFANHCCDAGLYGSRASTAYLNSVPAKATVDPTKDALDHARENPWESESRHVQAQRMRRRQWWDR